MSSSSSSNPPGTIAPTSLTLPLRRFQHAHSFPLSSSSTSGHVPFSLSSSVFFGSSERGGASGSEYTSEFVPRYAPIPESWTLTNPIPPSSPPPERDERIGGEAERYSEPAKSLLVPSTWGGSASTIVSSYLHTEYDQAQNSNSYFLDSTQQRQDGRMLGDDLEHHSPHHQYQSQEDHQLHTLIPNENDPDLSETERLLIKAANQMFGSSHPTIPSYRPPIGISPLRINHLAKPPTSSPDLDSGSPESGFDTPLSERQRRRKMIIAQREVKAKEEMDANPDEGPVTPTPVRFKGVPVPLVRSGSRFSLLDEEQEGEDDSKGQDERGRASWSPELEGMDVDVDEKEKDQEQDTFNGSEIPIELGKRRIGGDKGIKSTIITTTADAIPSSPPPEITPLKEIGQPQSTPPTSSHRPSEEEDTPSKQSEFELDSEVKEEDSSDSEDYPSSPYRPTSLTRGRGRGRARTSRTSYHPYATRLRDSSPIRPEEQDQDENQDQDLDFDMEGSGSTRGWAGKGQLKADEFRRYLEGPRSHRDPRFDLKVFHWAISGCPGMRWVKGGNGLEIKDVAMFYKNVLHKEAREKKEQQGKIATRQDLPGKCSFERQLSGYGFKRTTIGRSMVIERPDLRQDNQTLLRKVKKVWLDIEGGNLGPKVKPDKMSNNAVFLRKQVKDLQEQLEDKDVQMREVVRLLGVLLDNRSIDPVLLGDKLPKLDAGFVASLPADIIATLELQLALTDGSHRKIGASHSSSNPPKSRPKTKLPTESTTPLKPRDARIPLSESRIQNLENQPTPIKSIEDVLGNTPNIIHKSGTKTRSGMKKESRSDIKRKSKSKSKSRREKVDVGETIAKAGRMRSIRGQ